MLARLHEVKEDTRLTSYILAIVFLDFSCYLI